MTGSYMKRNTGMKWLKLFTIQKSSLTRVTVIKVIICKIFPISHTKQIRQANKNNVTFRQPTNDRCSPSYRNQSNDLHCKIIDWFLYDREYWSIMG